MLTISQKAAFIELLNKYQRQEASPAEIRFIEKYYRYFDAADRATILLTDEQKNLLENRIYRKIRQEITGAEKVRILPNPAYRSRRIAAAAILLVLFGSTYYLVNRSGRPTSPLAVQQINRYKNDVAPGANRATLTLDDGSSILLDSYHNGRIGHQGNARIVKLSNGELAYQPQPAVAADPENRFNKISTPNGGQYQVTLSDGSKVWLNAASTLRFPATFHGDRSVELTGEAYFEIATHYRPDADGKQEKVPFRVLVNGLQVQVLGTHFNVNAYDDEPVVRTTLLEGSVKLLSGNTSTLLRPGEESDMDHNGLLHPAANANVEDAVAWKNGMFQFRSAGIETIMRQVSRWYDVDVEYNKTINEKFYAEIPRNTNAAALFKILETTGAVHFAIDGRKVKVLP